MNSNFTKLMRFLLALILIVFGVNKFLKFIPLPELPDQASGFMSSLDATGYMLPIVGVLEIFIGVLLILKKWVGFALMLLAPISVNIVLFHVFLDLPGIGGALVVAILNGILIYKYWTVYRPLFH
ncbi:DoxX family membrane protein [Sungkyunkwania multivorans]|uniref:DoxX family membrane protein n=1 Tax=Sungkyunkwania multivorans TaxID=1173618 RepID=A0ABW3CZL6_9FLAO